MKRLLLVVGAAAALAWTAGAAKPRVSREAMAVLEKKIDRRIEAYSIDDPLYLLGSTRGVYLENYGAVFTTELNLVGAAVVTPFRPAFTKEQIEKLRLKKIDRVTALKKIMRDSMVDSATALGSVPLEENIVVGVTLFYYTWEDTTGLPAQVVMLARRQSLVDFEAGRLDSAGLEKAMQVEEL
jgi:hypothetical protein